MAQAGYLRHPALREDTIVFICDDDLWRVGSSGGVARRLTAGLGEPSTPALSPDGKWIAFVGRDEQHPEVYLMESGGGPAQRMTWLGPDVQVRGWTRDGKILFVEDTGEYLYSIDRMFWNLKRTGKLKNLKALIVGGFKIKPDDAGEEFGKTIQEI